ncbi:MAG: FAD-dependent oxidoreductase, partial [Betaproteobacteria bacterium]
ERTIGWRNPPQFFGEVPITLGTPFPGAYRAAQPSRVMRLDARQYYAIAAASPEVSLKVSAVARERIGGLQGIAATAPEAQVTIVGHRWDSACHDLRRFLARNHVVFDWMAPDAADLAARWPEPRPAEDDCPALRLTDGTTLYRPQARAVAKLVGLQTTACAAEYDTVIVGGGPAGLAAAVYGASEGLRTLVVEREAPGGQAGTSSRIENYLGFPSGVSGDELAVRALQQARRLGAEIVVTRNIERIDPATRSIVLDGDEVIRARTVILATGVTWRRLPIDGFDRLVGKGIYYGAARSEASSMQGRDIHLIGAGNSAGQAALFFANHAATVTFVVRGGSLEKSMSRYLVDQVRSKSNIRVELRSEVQEVHGDNSLAAIDIIDRSSDASLRLRRDVRLHRRRRGDRLAAGRDRTRSAWLRPDRHRCGEVRALVAGSRSVSSRNERPGNLRLWRCATESGQARRLRSWRGQHGNRFRTPASATAIAIIHDDNLEGGPRSSRWVPRTGEGPSS